MKAHYYTNFAKRHIRVLTCIALTLLVFTSVIYITNKPFVQNADKLKRLKLAFDKMERKVSMLDPEKDNLVDAYEFSGRAIKLTYELENEILSDKKSSKSYKEAISSAVNFWHEIDRTVGDTDRQANELINL